MTIRGCKDDVPARQGSLVTSRWSLRRSALFGLLCCVLLLGCQSTATMPAVPTISPEEPTRLLAELRGEIVHVDGCLRINDTDRDRSYLIAWTPEFRYHLANATVTITDTIAQTTIRVPLNTQVSSGGGIVSHEGLTDEVSQRLPAHCPGPYWLLTNIAPHR